MWCKIHGVRGIDFLLDGECIFGIGTRELSRRLMVVMKRSSGARRIISTETVVS